MLPDMLNILSVLNTSRRHYKRFLNFIFAVKKRLVRRSRIGQETPRRLRAQIIKTILQMRRTLIRLVSGILLLITNLVEFRDLCKLYFIWILDQNKFTIILFDILIGCVPNVSLLLLHLCGMPHLLVFVDKVIWRELSTAKFAGEILNIEILHHQHPLVHLVHRVHGDRVDVASATMLH